MIGHRLPDWKKHKEKMSTDCRRFSKLKEYVRIREGKSPHVFSWERNTFACFPLQCILKVPDRSAKEKQRPL